MYLVYNTQGCLLSESLSYCASGRHTEAAFLGLGELAKMHPRLCALMESCLGLRQVSNETAVKPLLTI